MVSVGKRRRSAGLMPAVALVAVPLGIVALLGAWGGASEGSRAVEMVQKVASSGKRAGAGGASQSDVVESMLKKSLADDVNQKEGKLYARALRRGGIKLDPKVERAVEEEVSGTKHSASSLAVSAKLQDDVKLASSIAMSHRLHKLHRSATAEVGEVRDEVHAAREGGETAGVGSNNRAAKLELASKILALEKKELLESNQHKGAVASRAAAAAHAAAPKPAAAKAGAGPAQHKEQHLSMKQALKRGLERKDAARLERMEHPEIAHKDKKKPAKPSAEQAIADSLKANLDDKVNAQLSAIDHKEMAQELAQHPDLARYIPKGRAGQQLAQKHSQKQAKRQQQLNVATKQVLAAANGGSLKDADTNKMTNVQIEKMLRSELDQHVNFALRNAEDKSGAVVGSKTIMDLIHSQGEEGNAPSARPAASAAATVGNKAVKSGGVASKAAVQQLSNVQLEADLRSKLNDKTSAMEKAELAKKLPESQAGSDAGSSRPKAAEMAQAEDFTGLKASVKARAEHYAGSEDEGGQLSNVELEAELRADLNHKTEAMEKDQLAKVKAMGKKGNKQAAAKSQAEDVAGGGGLPSDMQLEAALRDQLNDKTQAIEKSLDKVDKSAAVGGKIVASSSSPAAASNVAVEEVEGRHETAKELAVDKQRKAEYEMEGALKNELDAGVESKEKGELAADAAEERHAAMSEEKSGKMAKANMRALGMDLTGIKHTGRFGGEHRVASTASDAGGASAGAVSGGKPISRMAIESILRSQLNARVAQKVRDGSDH